MRLKDLLILTAFVLFKTNVQAQMEKRNLFPTPNAASLGIYGQIPVDFFNGLPQIDIPIYEYKSRDLSLPISLTYHAANIKPSDHASWVGLGWSLQAGGVITRVQNDLPDEFIDYDHPGTGAYLGREKKGFFFNYDALGDNNWLGSTFDEETSVFFTVGATGSEQYLKTLYRRDKAPDEFQFNFLGMGGSLFMGQDGQWKLKSKLGLHFSVKVNMGTYYVLEPTRHISASAGSKIKNCITDIILTGPDGTQYTFGGTPNSIEFIRIGIGTINSGSRDGGTIPKSWYLTKIKTIGGDEIILDYTRDGYQIMNNVNGVGYTYYCYTCTPYGEFYTGPGVSTTDQLSILSAVTLSSITGANGRLEFKKSRANILDFKMYKPNNIAQSTLQLFQAYGYEVFNGEITSSYAIPYTKSTYMKLDEVIVKDNASGVLKSFVFNYTENTNNRLFLNSVTPKNAAGTLLTPHKFTYNNLSGLAEVPYETTKVDHWGYYNGVDPLTGLAFPPISPSDYQSDPTVTASGTYYRGDAFDNTFATTYKNNRSPVASNMQYGVLKQIDYPTGGFTEFVWEPNKYSKIIDQTPVSNSFNITWTDLSSDAIGPGLRIQQIKSQANSTSPVVTKTYNYYRDYVNHTSYLSAGVLNSAPPKYVDDYYSAGNYIYKVWSTNNRVPMHYTNGSPITYSKVQEVYADGAFKEYIYANHDNGYLDKIPEKAVVAAYGNSAFQEFTTNSRELERGHLLKETSYRQDFLPLEKIEYLYNDDPNRFNENIRRYQFENKFTLNGTIINWQTQSFNIGPPAFTGANLYALNIYTFFPFLKKVTHTKYNQNGANPVIVVKDFTYDGFRNLASETTTSSKGEELKTILKYANDNLTGLDATATEAKTVMIEGHIVSLPLEKTLTRSGGTVSRTRTNYKFFGNAGTSLVRPYAQELQLGNANMEVREEYNNYDLYGNLISENKTKDYPTSYQWGYRKAYPVAKVINARNTYRNYTKRVPASGSGNFIWYPGQFHTQTVQINHARNGNITIAVNFGAWPSSGVTMNMTYTLTGPQSRSGTLCIGNPQSACPSDRPSSITFANMPAGVYTLSAYTASNYSVSVTGFYYYESYNDVPTTEGVKEFFHDNFEEGSGWDGNLTAYDKYKAHTGRYSGRIDKASSTGEQYSHSTEWIDVSLSGTTRFKYSGWIYSNGPSAEIFLFMKTATESGYFTYVSSVVASQTNKWVYVEGYYDVPATITKLNIRIDNNGGGSVWFDDLRLHPVTAQMATFTYDPLVGMTSSTDINNKVTHYEYDGFGRLLLVRDENKDILKKICYNYQGQQVDCTINTAAQWQATGNYSCVQDDYGNTGYQIREERDENPLSPTYGQTREVSNGYNPSACPLPSNCDYSNCDAQGEGYTCISGQCEFGYKVYTHSYYDNYTGQYECIYHYEFSDGSWSQDYWEYSWYPCPI